MNKKILIKTEGCDIYKHGFVYDVLELKDGVYPTLNESDRIPAEWCEEIDNNLVTTTYINKEGIVNHIKSNPIPVFSMTLMSWNQFRRLGYYKDGTKTGYFRASEYKEFEEYSVKNNLDISKYE